MSRLRVALDGRPLQSEPLGGVGRYLTGVLPWLAAEADISVLLDARRPRRSLPLPPTVRTAALAAPPYLPGLGWLEVSVGPWLRQSGAVFHGTFNTLPLTWDGRTVLTLHDLAPQQHPADFGALTRVAWRVAMRASVQRASVITTVSSFTRGEIARHFGVDADKVAVAPLALDPRFDPGRSAHAAALAGELGVRGPYFVAVGGAPRRGLPVAIAAWLRAREQAGLDACLAVVGETRLPDVPGLVALGTLHDDAWATVLAGAQGLIYPTRYEGFGLPALEALASGTPVICAPVASLPEVLGPAACWTPDATPDAFAEVIARLAGDPDWHAERVRAGLARARAAPTWEQSASTLLLAYERANE